jgi:hypothetical protein
MNDDRVGTGTICLEFTAQTGKDPPASINQIRAWLADGVLGALEPKRINGRWSVRRDRIPLLEGLAPVLIDRAMARMRHEHLRQPEAAA